MNKGNIIRYSLVNSSGTALYIFVIVLFINFLGKAFNGNNESVIIPIAMLMLFVISAAITGALVFGRPVAWYLDGKKREAILLLISTIVILVLITIVVFLFLIYFQLKI